jgi:mono/diheme cytochrome c family protein
MNTANHNRSLIIALCLLLSTCAGPQPLHVAILPHHQDDYVERLNRENYDGRLAWLKWQADKRGITLDAASAADDRISTTRNPFMARIDHDAVSLGAVIFQMHCARCHGEDARGGGPALLPGMQAKDFHAPLPRIASTLYGGRPDKWFRIITNGRGNIVEYPDEPPGPAMPAFGDNLAREQIWLAITYLQSLDVYSREATTRSDHSSDR